MTARRPRGPAFLRDSKQEIDIRTMATWPRAPELYSVGFPKLPTTGKANANSRKLVRHMPIKLLHFTSSLLLVWRAWSERGIKGHRVASWT